jgi:hypothetical protein
MRLLLVFIFSFISIIAFSQAPPMNIGGPQGVNVKRILTQDWMSIPIMMDTPASPLTGSGWPGKGYLAFVAKADSTCLSCPPNDTSVWEYTGARWKRVGMDYTTKLVFGGNVSPHPTISRRYVVSSYGAFINGNWYRTISNTNVNVSPKTADSTSRIDVIVITTTGVSVKTGQARLVPFKPVVTGDEIELSTVFFRAFDTTARFLPSTSTGVSSIFRVAGKDSIFYTIDTTTFALKDSIGVSTSSNGLTASGSNVKLGGSLTENTNLNLSSSRLNVLAGSDTTRFFSNGSISVGATPSDSTYRFNVNGGVKADSVIVDSLYAKFGRQTGEFSVPFTPLEFRVDAGKTRIDLRPSSNASWNSNWYGAITHNGSQTDILYSNYGSLLLSSNTPSGGGGIFIGNNRTSPYMYVRPLGNVLINTTSDSTFRLDVNGRTRLRDTLTLPTSPVTADTTENDLLVINSSNGQVRRFTGAFPSNYTASNGLTLSGNSFRLGGSLTQNTTISGSNTRNLTIDSLTSFSLRMNSSSYFYYGSNIRLAFVDASSVFLGNPFGEAVGISNGRAQLQKINNSNSQGVYVSTDSIFLQSYNDGTSTTSRIQPQSSDTLKFKILTINNTTGSLSTYTGAWPSVPLTGSATLDFPNTGHGNSADLTFTLTGAAEGDVVALGIPNASIVANASYIAWVSATDTITVRFNNYASSGSSDPASGTFKIKVFK